MRSDFENLPEIEGHLHNVVFDEGSNEYLAKKMGHLPFEFSEWFLNGSWTIYQHQQSKVDELQLKLSEDSRILHNVIEIERKKNDELRKRVDAVQRLIESWNMTNLDKSTHFNDGYEEGCFNCARDLEQALKGGEDANQ